MKKIFTVIVVLLTTINSQSKDITGTAANKLINGTSKITLDDKTGFPSFIYLSPGKEIPVQNFEKWVRASFKTTSSFGLKVLHTSVDEKNSSHIHYQETWNGIPVANTMWIAHVQNGKVISCNGWFVPVINAGIDNSLSESTALNFVLAYTNAKTYRWQSPVYERMAQQQKQTMMETLYPKGELFFASKNGDNKNFSLCYRFDVYATTPLSRNYVFVDASTGVIVNKINRIADADATGTAVTGYLGTQTIITDSFNGEYRLREADRGDGVETYNLQTGTDYANAVDFTDADNNWNNVNANLDQYATDAHYGAEMTYDYYWLNHNRNSIDDQGMKLLSYVHYDVGYYNAFWDGSEMTYGDGNGMPLTSLDVCGHEISHGVTENTCGLIYQDEPGGLNEGYSDCIGTAVEFYAGGATADWLIGEDFGTPFRNMADPNMYQNPDTYLGQYWVAAGGFDNGGVHTNSGVLNYWFYLMSEGGSGTNDNGYAYNVSGIGIGPASDILYKAWRDYMFSNAQFADARESTLNAATDIYGACSPEVILVANAWHAVGVGGDFSATVAVDFSQDIASTCMIPAIFNFQNLSSNVSNFTWYFGDGTSSNSINPNHTYLNNGVYDVKLVGTGGCGADSVIQTGCVTVNHPLGPLAVDGTNCSTGTVTLTASGGGGTLKWFDVPNGGNPIGSGSSFTTPFLSSTATYYVEEQDSSPFIFAGPFDNTIGSTNNYSSNTDRYQYFDVYQPVKLISVKVFAQGSANREFQLLDVNGNILMDTTINVPNGTQEVFLNWNLPVGTGMQLGVLAVANLFRNTDGAAYPYTTPGYLSITGNSANDPDRYYFLYNWKLQPPTCISVRVPVIAAIGNLNTSLTPSGNINICDGQTEVLSAASGASSYLWSNGESTQVITVSSSGIYSVVVSDGTGCTGASPNATVNVTSIPSPVYTFTNNGLSYNFNAAATGASSYSWNFGDGTNGTGQTPSHIYGSAGTVTVTLIVCNNNCCDTSVQTIEVNTGIENISGDKNWFIFPNPTFNNFNLTYSGNEKIESLTLYNTLGQVVWSTVTGNNKNWIVNAESLSNGTYFLTVQSAMGYKVFKLEKLK